VKIGLRKQCRALDLRAPDVCNCGSRIYHGGTLRRDRLGTFVAS